jgi:hypothetical protein
MNKFQLELNTLEVLGLYDIPAQRMFATPSTRIGTANQAPHSIVSISVNLDTLALHTMMENKLERIYLQAALLSRADYDAGNFEAMILSEVDVIRFVMGNDCPEDRQDFTESAIPGAVFTK